jgi:hypothetical protein
MGPAGMGPDVGAPPPPGPAMAYQDAMDRRRPGPLDSGMGVEQELVELAGTPAPGLAKLEDLADHCGRGGMGTLLRPVGAVGETVGAEAGVAVEPLVAGLAAHPVAAAELGEARRGVLGVVHETLRVRTWVT